MEVCHVTAAWLPIFSSLGPWRGEGQRGAGLQNAIPASPRSQKTGRFCKRQRGLPPHERQPFGKPSGNEIRKEGLPRRRLNFGHGHCRFFQFGHGGGTIRVPFVVAPTFFLSSPFPLFDRRCAGRMEQAAAHCWGVLFVCGFTINCLLILKTTRKILIKAVILQEIYFLLWPYFYEKSCFYFYIVVFIF